MWSKRIFQYAAFAAAFVFFGFSCAKAELKLEVTSGTHAPIPLAVPAFTDQAGGIGAQISAVISADLQNSGLFHVINPAAYIQKSEEVLTHPQFSEWKILNAQALLAGRVVPQGGEMRVEFYLFDVLNQKPLIQSSFISTSDNWRRLAHKIADEVYKRLTGEEPYFDTRIVYVAQHGSRKNKVRRLAVMDQDGANHRYLTDGRFIVLTPRFSPTTHEITYLGFDTKPASVHLMNLQTGQKQTLGRFSGMTYAPRFSVDGRGLVMSFASRGASSLYAMDLAHRQPRKLTQSTGYIDTSATYSPDGGQLVFNSDRGGTPQLYVMSATGGEATRISFGGGRYYTPVWSPRGDLIVFIKSHNGMFNLGVMRPDGSGERIIFQSYLLESPTWAPNGRVLMFAAQSSLSSPSKLYTIDLTGNSVREIITPEEATHPAWSPLIP